MRPRTLPRAVAPALALALSLSACEKKRDADFSGTYRGDAIDSQNSSNRKEFTLTIAAANTVVAGTYQIKAILIDTNGIVSGTLTGSQLALVLTPSANDCPYRITGTWSGDRITGSYEAFNCFVRSDGTLTLRKQ
jgi:hypothetical protein